MAKNIVILLDGTANEITRKRTNILRLYGTLEKGDRQLAWYDPGVGTFGGDDPLTGLRAGWHEFMGKFTGIGMHANVRQAYRFLCHHYSAADDRGEPDRIWLIGFSRGAYTARVLAGFIHAFGVMEPRNLNLLDYVYRDYRRVDEAPDLAAAVDRRDGPLRAVNLHRRALQPYHPTLHCLGLFDTVASVIERRGWWFGTRLHAFTHQNPSVRHLRHALAIDERRVMYRPRPWGRAGLADLREGTGQTGDVKEEWFAGVHADVGGGRDEAQSGLGKVPLDWMVTELRALGLHLEPDLVAGIVHGKTGDYVAPDPAQGFADSMSPGWQLVEGVPFLRTGTGIAGRRILGIPFPGGAHRVIPEGAVIHASVADRMRARPDYRPPNLPASHAPEDDTDPPEDGTAAGAGPGPGDRPLS